MHINQRNLFFMASQDASLHKCSQEGWPGHFPEAEKTAPRRLVPVVSAASMHSSGYRDCVACMAEYIKTLGLHKDKFIVV